MIPVSTLSNIDSQCLMSHFSALNRRYLRISKNTTLEVRIYLHPDLIPTFTDDLLKKLITSVRPLIIPKLKEENAKKNDKKPTRDYIHEPEFDASVFLLPTTTPHAVLNRTRDFTFEEQEEEGHDAKPTLRTDYTGFSIYGRSLCLVVDPPMERQEGTVVVSGRKKKGVKKGKGGIEEWFVNTRNDVPAIDDS